MGGQQDRPRRRGRTRLALRLAGIVDSDNRGAQKLHRSAGMIDMAWTASNGEIEAIAVDGPLKADTRDGNIRIDGVFSALDVHSGDGNISAEAGSGSKMSSGWVLRTGDGNVQLRVPDGFAADLDAHTGDGQVSVDLPVTMEGSFRESTVRGKMNGGGKSLELRSGDGNITVAKS